ncbi:MAG: hypothetical protein WC993_06345 [Methanoculleus sp.]
MSGQFIFTRYRTDCYNCGEDADQVIKAVSSQAQVICSNCGATRIFVPRFVNMDIPGACTPLGRYDVWSLRTDAQCKNCGVHGAHDLVVGTGHLTVRCRNCGYTHFYRFNLEYIGQCPIDDEGVSAPPAP